MGGEGMQVGGEFSVTSRGSGFGGCFEKVLDNSPCDQCGQKRLQHIYPLTFTLMVKNYKSKVRVGNVRYGQVRE